MPNYSLSGRQLAWLVAVFIISPAIINMPQHLAKLAYMDAWATQLLPLVYGFAICYVYYRLAKVFPGKTFFEISFLLAGRIGGGIINILFLLHMWFILVKNSTLFIGFIKTNLLLRTPYEVSLFLLILVLIYYGKTSIEVATRVNDIFFAVLAFMIVLIPLLVSNDISLYQLLPVMVEPIPDVAVASGLSTTWYGDVIVFAAFLPVMSNAKLMNASIRHGLAIAALLITWVLLAELCVLGPSIMAREIYPTYALIQQIHITDFLDRVELFIFSVYFPSFIVSITLSFLAILIGLGSFDRSNRPQVYSKMTGWFILITLVFAFEGTPEVSNFANYAYPVFVFALQPLASGIVLLLSFRKIKNSSSTEQQSTNMNGTKHEGSSNASKKSYRKWNLLTYLLIVIGLASAAVGLSVSHDFQWLGRVCAVIYILVLLFLVVSTNREMNILSES